MIVRFILDPTTMVANMLAGGVDLIIPPSIDVDAAVELKRRWEGTANRVLFDLTTNHLHRLRDCHRIHIVPFPTKSKL